MQVSDAVNQYYNNLASGSEISTKTRGVQQLTSTVDRLTPGQIFEGSVTSVKGSQVVLSLSNGQNITARINTDLSFTEGQSVFFEVESNDGSTVMIHPVAAGTENNPTLLSALDSANLSVTERNLNLVNTMMQQKMPIDAKTLTAMSQLAASYPDADIKTLVTMKRLDFPITKEMITQFENYRASENTIREAAGNIAGQISSTLSDSAISSSQAGSFLSAFTDVLDGLHSTRSLADTDASALVSGLSAEAADLPEVLSDQPEFQPQATTVIISDSAEEAAPSAFSEGGAQNVSMDAQTAAVLSEENGAFSLTEEAVPSAEEQETRAASGAALDSASAADPSAKENVQTVSPDVLSAENAYDLTLEETDALPFNAPLRTLGASDYRTLSDTLKQIPGFFESNPQLFDDSGKLLEDLSSRDILRAISESLTTGKKSDFSSLLSSGAFEKLLSDSLSKRWSLSPDQLAQTDSLKRLYSKIDLELSTISRAAETMTGRAENAISQSASLVQDNISFINQVNSVYSYVQIPLKLSGQNTTADLYVYTNRNAHGREDGEVTAFLHFDLDHLGTTDISVKMRGNNVRTDFFLADDASYELIRNNLHILEARLSDLGYSCQLTAENKGRNVNLITDVMEKDADRAGEIHRYSFDMRA